MRVGVVAHLGYEGLDDLVALVTGEASRLGMELYFESSLRSVAGADARLLEDPHALDGLLAFGGDGTFLRAARELQGARAPIFGVNLGKLGFLTECSARAFPELLPRFACGDFTSESRMTLEASAIAPDGSASAPLRALNDVVLHKGGFARVMRLRVSVNGESIGSLAADGMVTSTPTGSTAYSLSAGGPIVAPTHDSIVVTPVAAHALAIRPFILPPDAVLELQADDASEEVLVTVDGQVGITLGTGQTLTVRRSPHPVNIARFDDTSFFERLRVKMGWGGLVERDR